MILSCVGKFILVMVIINFYYDVDVVKRDSSLDLVVGLATIGLIFFKSLK